MVGKVKPIVLEIYHTNSTWVFLIWTVNSAAGVPFQVGTLNHKWPIIQIHPNAIMFFIRVSAWIFIDILLGSWFKLIARQDVVLNSGLRLFALEGEYL